MAEYCGYITRLHDVHPLPNSDHLLAGKCYDDNVIVDKSYEEGQLVVYFMAGTQLGEDYCIINHLVRKIDENGKNVGGYLEKSRAVKAINLRGSKSDGLCLPVDSLSRFIEPSTLNEGDKITSINGVIIATKYIPPHRQSRTYVGAHKKKVVTDVYPYFMEHSETEHLDKCLQEFLPGDHIQVTCKADGTSGRTAYTLREYDAPQTWWQKLLRLKPKHMKQYEYVSGTRHTIIKDESNDYYGSNKFRIEMAKKIQSAGLMPGEEIFYEIVGYAGTDGKPLRPIVDNSLVNDKAFVKQYGRKSEFKYGCNQGGGYEKIHYGDNEVLQPCCKLLVYRMNYTQPNTDYTIEYTPYMIKRRCDQMHLDYVYEFEEFFIPKDCENPGEYVMAKAKQYYDGPEPLDPSHIREGIVVRIVNRNKFKAYKLKNHNYKVLAGIAMDSLVESGAINELSQDVIEEL